MLTATTSNLTKGRQPLRLGAALVGLWYLLVYTHLAALALAHFAPPESGRACCCAASGRSGHSCCDPAGGAHADQCSLPDESLGCHGPRVGAGTVCLLAGGCEDELPAAPQTDALTWPHLAATAYALQPRLHAADLTFGTASPSFSHISIPPDKVPKHLA